MKRGTANHPKADALRSELEGLGNPHPGLAMGILNSLWDWATSYVPQGNIGKYSNKVIATKCGWSGEPDELIAALIRTGWVDDHLDHRLIIHDWSDHCEDSVHTQLARRGLLFADETIPKITKLNEKERQAIEARYRGQLGTSREPFKAEQGEATPEIRTECAEPSSQEAQSTPRSALPIAMPRPLTRSRPLPVRARTQVGGTAELPPAEGSTDWDEANPEKIAKGIVVELSLAGDYLLRTLTDLVAGELKREKDPKRIRATLTEAWRICELARQEGKLKWPLSPEKFFGNGVWKDPMMLPWKEGHEPKKLMPATRTIRTTAESAVRK